MLYVYINFNLEHDFLKTLNFKDMNKHIVTLDFINYNIPTKIVLYRHIIIKVCKNNHLNLPDIFIEYMRNFTDNLESAYLKSINNKNKNDLKILESKESAVDRLFLKVAAHVNESANGSKRIINSYGFQAHIQENKCYYF